MYGAMDNFTKPLLNHSVVDDLFPHWSQEQCNPFVSPIKKFDEGVDIRFPLLIPIQLLGVAIGVYGLIMSVSSLVTSRKEFEDHWAWSAHWSWAFFFYMLMNLSSLPAHSIFEVGGKAWRWAWDGDMLTTGAACINLFLVGIKILQQQWHDGIWSLRHRQAADEELFQEPPLEIRKPEGGPDVPPLSGTTVFNLFLTLALGLVVFEFDDWRWRAEAVYVLWILAAGLSLSLAMIGQLRAAEVRSDERRAIAGAWALAGGLCAFAPVSDAPLCRVLRSGAFGPLHVLFLGTAVAMYFLLRHLMAARSRILRTRVKAKAT